MGRIDTRRSLLHFGPSLSMLDMLIRSLFGGYTTRIAVCKGRLLRTHSQNKITPD